jgi:hypothetical protein
LLFFFEFSKGMYINGKNEANNKRPFTRSNWSLEGQGLGLNLDRWTTAHGTANTTFCCLFLNSLDPSILRRMLLIPELSWSFHIEKDQNGRIKREFRCKQQNVVFLPQKAVDLSKSRSWCLHSVAICLVFLVVTET